MIVVFASHVDSICNATINIETCIIQSAVVLYDIVLQNDSVTMNLDSSPQVLSPDVSRGDSLSAQQGGAAGVLAGLEWLGYSYFRSNATLDHEETDGLYCQVTNGILANQYDELKQADYSNYATCTFQFRNATDDLIKDLHEVVFRSAWYLSNGIAQVNYEYFA